MLQEKLFFYLIQSSPELVAQIRPGEVIVTVITTLVTVMVTVTTTVMTTLYYCDVVTNFGMATPGI